MPKKGGNVGNDWCVERAFAGPQQSPFKIMRTCD